MDRWKIIYYKTPSGRFPVKEFIDNLEELARSRTYNTLELLAEFGINLGLPYAKKQQKTQKEIKTALVRLRDYLDT